MCTSTLTVSKSAKSSNRITDTTPKGKLSGILRGVMESPRVSANTELLPKMVKVIVNKKRIWNKRMDIAPNQATDTSRK